MQRAGSHILMSISHPHLLDEWDFVRNIMVDPSSIFSKSNKKVWWCCCFCGHEWISSIYNRASGKGCPACAGKVATHRNNLLVNYPEICEEWDYDKNNTLRPEQVVPGSHNKVWWKCKKCNWSWISIIKNRTLHHSSCPACSNQVVTPYNNLAVLYKDIAFEWHPTKNGSLRPCDVGAHTGRSAWWKCENGHEWCTGVHNRTKPAGTGCPKCCRGNISKMSQKWLDRFGILPENREIWIRVAGKRFKVDAYVPETNTVYEFLGDFWHGNPKLFDPNEEFRFHSYKKGKTFGEVYKTTMCGLGVLVDAGYNVVYIWESDFREGNL